LDSIPGLAKGTTSIELESGAEKAAAAKPEALGPKTYRKAGHGCVGRNYRCKVQAHADARGTSTKRASKSTPCATRNGEDFEEALATVVALADGSWVIRVALAGEMEARRWGWVVMERS